MNSTFLTDIIDKFGESIVMGEEKKVDSIPTGSFSLDVSTGIGGLPRGRFTEIYGPEGSGKTTLALTMAKNVTLAGGRVLYLDA